MKVRGIYKKVVFDTIKELKEFVENLGEAYFYNAFTDDVLPIRIDEVTDKAVIGGDGWDRVERGHLEDIYGYIKIDE